MGRTARRSIQVLALSVVGVMTSALAPPSVSTTDNSFAPKIFEVRVAASSDDAEERDGGDVAQSNAPPTVTISDPADGSTFAPGDTITFTATASDIEDGVITGNLSWESDVDGVLGTGGTFTRSDLSEAGHTITATVADSGGLTALDSVSINVVSSATVLVGAGDISTCANENDEATAALLDNIAGMVFTTGDNVYEDGTDLEFSGCYDPTWGRHKARTRPTPGNHDYHVAEASGYFSYFGSAAGEIGKGYYSYNLGDWHIIALNSECSRIGGCGTDSPQGQWLQADLAANPSTCTLAYWHKPRFSSGFHRGSTLVQPFWELLYDAGGDVVLNGHDHSYERFAPQDPTASADPGRGIREFVVGTGGRSLRFFGLPARNSEVRDSNTYGVLKLTLHPTSYDWEFVPIAGQTFTDSGSAECVTSSPPNLPPTANDDSTGTSEDTPLSIDVAANDSDPDGNLDPSLANTTCAACLDPASGSLVNIGDGAFTYTPSPDFNGSDSFVYEICDTLGACDTATVTITVTAVPDPPVAKDDTASPAEDTPVTIDTTANDSDPDGDLDPASANTTCATCSEPGNGTLVNNGNGTFDYTPDPDFNGSDGFVYEICDSLGACDTAAVTITVTPVPDPPVASDDTRSTAQETPVTIDATANDSDPDGNLDPASANTTCATCAQPANGSLVNNGDGTFDYTPDPGFTGSDSFVYEVCDTDPTCDTATVIITSLAPTILEVRVAAGSDDAEERGNGDVALWSSDLELVFDSGGNQAVGMRFNGIAIPQGASIVNAYVQFQVDETAPTSPTNLTIQGQDVNNATTFATSNGNISSRPRTTAAVSWSPVPWTTVGEAGPDQQTPDIASVVQEIVSRRGWASDNSLVIIITGTGERVAESYNGVPAAAPLLHMEYVPNDRPVATDDSASTFEDIAVTIDVAANDSDPDGNLDPASATTTCATCADPGNGTLVNNGNGTFDYTPDPDFNGFDGFVYEICDSLGACDTATVTIAVTSVPDPPLANDDSASTAEDMPLSIDAASNDTDPDGDLDPASVNTTCAGCADPANGSLVNNGNGTFDHTPDPNFNGSDSFVYQICDTLGACDTATVTITVTAVPDPPVANDDSVSTSEDMVLTIDVAANDTDPDGDLDSTTANTSCAGCADPANGSLVNGGDGTFTYSPNPDFNGSDSFVYQICDTLGACDTATVSITVTPVADPPVANDDSASTVQDTPVTIDTTANDSDPDGNLDPASANTTCATCADPANGTAVNSGNGTFDYTPDPGFIGSDSFVYEVCDTDPKCGTATVSITVNPLAPTIIEVRVAASSDDAEERDTGGMRLLSSDLELVFDGGGNQTVGMRFSGVTIPQGASIVNAYVQFQVDETAPTGPTDLTIQGEAIDNAPVFDNTKFSISTRTTTTAAVPWAPVPWTTKGEAGPDQRTPDIASVVQEIVGRSGWASGNSLVIIITGTGERVAESYNGDQSGAPLLHVEYSM